MKYANIHINVQALSNSLETVNSVVIGCIERWTVKNINTIFSV